MAAPLELYLRWEWHRFLHRVEPMWAELIIPGSDLEHLLRQAVPLTIYFGADRKHSLGVSALGEARLVTGLGLRAVCKGTVTWPVLGVELPMTLNSFTLLMLPMVGAGEHGDILRFRFSIEHADFAGIPSGLDKRITDAINAKLDGKDVELTWDCSRGLTHLAPLPRILDPLASFAIRPAWATVKITEEAVVYAMSFHSAIVRRGERPPADLVLPTQSGASA